MEPRRIYSEFGTLSEDAHSFEVYWEQFVLYAEARRFPLSRRKALFLSTLAPRTYALLRGLTAPDAPSSRSLEEIRGLLQGHYALTALATIEKGKAAKALQYVCYICGGDSCQGRICKSLDDELPPHGTSVSSSTGVPVSPPTAEANLSALFPAPEHCLASFDGLCTTATGECSRGTACSLAVAFAVAPEPPQSVAESYHVDSPAEGAYIYGQSLALASLPVDVPEPADRNLLCSMPAAPTPVDMLVESSALHSVPELVDQTSAPVVPEESCVTNLGDSYVDPARCALPCERPDRGLAEAAAIRASVLQDSPEREARSLWSSTGRIVLLDYLGTYKRSSHAAKYAGHEPKLPIAIPVWRPNAGERRKRDQLALWILRPSGSYEGNNTPGKRKIKRWLMAPPKKRHRGISGQASHWVPCGRRRLKLFSRTAVCTGTFLAAYD